MSRHRAVFCFGVLFLLPGHGGGQTSNETLDVAALSNVLNNGTVNRAIPIIGPSGLPMVENIN